MLYHSVGHVTWHTLFGYHVTSCDADSSVLADSHKMCSDRLLFESLIFEGNVNFVFALVGFQLTFEYSNG